MRTLTSLMIAMAVGASAPAAAQTAPDVEAELDAELDRAAPPTEGEAAADDVDEKKEKEKKKRTERVVETTTEYDTEDLVLPSAEELFSTGGEIDEDDDDEPRAPRAVVRERVVERPVEPDPPEERVERDDEGPKVVAGDEEARSSLGRWIELEGEGPGEARAGRLAAGDLPADEAGIDAHLLRSAAQGFVRLDQRGRLPLHAGRVGAGAHPRTHPPSPTAESPSSAP